jgi:CSLREA domain-containing protein
MIRSLLCGFLSILTLLGVATTAVAGNGAEKVTLTGPKAVEQDVSSALTLKLPGRVRAVSGRVLYDTSAVELIGIAPKGKGEVLSPDDVQGGSAFATYGLKAKGATVLRIVFVAHVSGRIQFNVVLDSMATGPGARTTVSSHSLTTTVSVGSGSRFYGAPTAAPASAPRLAATSMARDLNGDGLVGQFDLDNVRAAWAASGDTCAAVDASADANADGCVDVVDMQDVTADSGSVVGTLRASGDTARLMTSSTSTANTSNSKTSTAKAAKAVANAPFVVNSTADTPDAKNGDGICADSRGRCTLRAAITESNWQKGANTINFNISGAGSAPVVIQMTSNMSLIQDKTGGTTIDGYTQPGAHVNTATVGSNAIPGIELRGLTSDNKRDNGFFITSANNVIRGFVMNDHYRSFYTDTDEAHDNYIVGNWIGFNANGSNQAHRGANGIRINTGSTANHIGTSNLADRNVIGNYTHPIDFYGPTTRANFVQGNVLCMTPSGMATAYCATGIDHNFGPKDNLEGGPNPGDRNVIGLSPRGEAAPIGRYGINVRTSTKTGLIEGNEIHNAAVYGIGLTNQNVMWFTLTKNIITDMTGPAIFEAPNPNKPSTGANNLLAPPIITSATTSRANGTGIKGATVEVYRASRNSGQSGLPVEYLGSGLVGSDGKWSVNISTAQGNRVVALQTNAAGNTSVLGTNVTVGEQQGPVVVAQDDFARTVTNSWGAAAVGGTYTLQGTAGNYDVANGSATIRVPAAGNTRAAMLNSTSQRDVDLRVRVSTDKVAAGGQYAMFAVARRNTNNEYRAKLIFNANGSVAVQASVVNNGKESPLGGAVTVSGLTQAADSYIWLRATVSGANPTAINVKAWKDGSAEPSGWQFSATDSTASVQGAGSVGLRLWLQGKVTNAPVTFRFDDYSALALN